MTNRGQNIEVCNIINEVSTEIQYLLDEEFPKLKKQWEVIFETVKKDSFSLSAIYDLNNKIMGAAGIVCSIEKVLRSDIYCLKKIVSRLEEQTEEWEK